MALRNQPYLPLYVQDFLTDEKLIECSAESTGVYIRLLCIMHKSEEYGAILLKQKDKQKDKQIENFAYKIAKQMPYDIKIIESSLKELINEKVIILDEDKLIQKRMVNDNYISEIRAKSGSKGGKKTKKNIENFAQAKRQANSEDEDEDVNKNIYIELYNYIERIYNRTINSIEYSNIEYYINIFKEDPINIIKYAYDLSLLNNVKKFSYVKAILENWKTAEYKTLKEIQEKEKPIKKETKKDLPVLADYDWLNESSDT